MTTHANTAPTITREDIVRSIGGDRLDGLLAEPYGRDDPDLGTKIDARLAWALELGVAELSQYIDLTQYGQLAGLYREYAVLFALYHLERTTRASVGQDAQAAYDLAHKNLALAHKAERLPGERHARSVVRAEVIEDATPWSTSKMEGLL